MPEWLTQRSVLSAVLGLVVLAIGVYRLYTRIHKFEQDREDNRHMTLDQPLFDALNGGSVDGVAAALAKGAEVNGPPGSSTTPLMDAAEKPGSAAIATLLLDHGANLNAHDNFFGGETALDYASEADSLDVITVLIDRGAQVEATDDQKWTALFYAIKAGHADAVKLLLDRGASPEAKSDDLPVLAYAASQGAVDSVRLLLEHGALPNEQTSDGQTNLMEAIFADANSLDMVKLLVAHGADVRQASPDGISALDLAVGAGKIDVAKFLVQHGAKN